MTMMQHCGISNRLVSATVCLVLLLLFMGMSYSQTAQAVDLGTWSFQAQGPVKLNTGWTVFRGRVVSPAVFNDMQCQLKKDQTKQGQTSPKQAGPAPGAISRGQPVTLPDIWGPALTTRLATGHGKATYCMALHLPAGDQFYALRMGAVRSSSAIYVQYRNKRSALVTELLHQNGALHASNNRQINNPMPPLLTLPYGVQNLMLLVQVENSIHKQGGLIEVPLLDVKWRLQALDNRETAMPSALVIVLFTIAVGAVIVGLRYDSRRGHNIFAFLAFASAVRVLFVSDIVWDYFPTFPLARKYDLEYLSFFLIAPAYYAFVAYLFRGYRIIKADYLVYGLSAALVVFTLFITPFLPPGTVTLLREPMQALWAIIGVVVAKTLYSTVFYNPKQHQEVLVVILAAFSILIYESLSALGVIAASQEWSQVLLLFVMLMHTKAFVSKSRRIERERDMLVRNLKEANETLEKRAISLDLALIRAEEASKSKSEFLATISHELRTPLNAIIGFAEMMEREVFGPLGSDHYREYLRDTHEAGAHLLSLVDDILDLARLDSRTKCNTQRLCWDSNGKILQPDQPGRTL